jgi:glutamate-ammonia-ligase adenylyltransferase
LKDAIVAALKRARAHAPFLEQMVTRHPDITAALAAGDLRLAEARLDDVDDDMPAGRLLRHRRGRLALVAAIADLGGAWDLNQVTARLSAFADEALDIAIATAFAERYPDTPPCGLAVIALGKHGSNELNYSSDIDPILLFDPDSIPHGSREEPADVALRLARRVVELLTQRDGDGYVFRVDLRLRPSPEATPIILPVDGAIAYYESSALGWEQAAFIRARAAAGDIALGTRFLQAIRPFVWRRSLDFGAIRQITDISRRIRDHYAQGQAFGPGYDLKRGRGGIREVEFFAQIHQLIHGGRNPALRAPATRNALAALADAAIIESDVAARLDDAYLLYRTIEHRLQMVDDRQTHALPANADAIDNVARLAGMADGAALLDSLAPHVAFVGSNYDRLSQDEGEDNALSQEPERLAEQLTGLGFADVETPLARIARWREGSARALRSAPARAALEELLPGLMAGLARAPDPVSALNRLDDLVGRLPSAINFFRLLAARPSLVAMLAAVLSHAPTLADALSRRAELLDALMDASALDPLPNLDVLIGEIGALEPGDDYQTLLDRVRQRVGDRRFALGVQIVLGAADPLDAGAGYGRLAEAAIATVGQATVAEFERAHGCVPGGELAILALGRLGGGVLTHASDLDLIFLFSGDFAAESDGQKPLGATHYFNRLAQRVIAALTVQTAAGPLYDVDVRLRPSGAQGPLAVSFDSFARYQREGAWTWEHLALTRARPVFGSPEARAALSAMVADTLHAPRDIATLGGDAVRMRADIAIHKTPAGPLDVKLTPGGLIDLEFLIHINQFRNRIGFHPNLGEALSALIAAGALPAELAPAHDLLTRYLIVSRLVAPGGGDPAQASHKLVAQACGAEDWLTLLARIDAARQSIADAWAAIVRTFGGSIDAG